MQQHCGVQRRTVASPDCTSLGRAKSDVLLSRLTLHCNSEGKCYPDLIGWSKSIC